MTPGTVPDFGTLLFSRVADEILRYAYAFGTGTLAAVLIGLTAAAVVAVMAGRPERRRRPRIALPPRATYAGPRRV